MLLDLSDRKIAYEKSLDATVNINIHEIPALALTSLFPLCSTLIIFLGRYSIEWGMNMCHVNVLLLRHNCYAMEEISMHLMCIRDRYELFMRYFIVTYIGHSRLAVL